ncbi:MAG: hypothetical protein K0A99_06455 [Desulfoarculaceae bacterium]|nr:hypothetical protein [Desulfoarculaceae bacterium]
MATSLLVAGCGGGSDSYSEPEATKSAPIEGQTQSVLIDAATLKGWIDQGLVNNDEGWEKIVILNGEGKGGRIPGSQKWTGPAGIERYDGPVLSSSMVLDGPTMDSLLQQHGIDERTTVVFANGRSDSRAYFTFRYWGFPKERLKVLDGGVAAWTAADYALTTVEPVITPSDYGVNNLQFNPSVRAALSELIIAVRDETAIPLNVLTNNTEKAGGTTGIFAPSAYCDDDLTYPYTEFDKEKCLSPQKSTNDFVIFQGTINGGQHLNHANFYETVDGVMTAKSAEDIKALLLPLGIDGTKPIIIYCRAGIAASYAFMPIDAALDWDIMVYDGSWSQWGSLTNELDRTIYVPDASYALPAELSEWATDVLTRDGYTLVNNGPFFPGIYYNINFPKVIEKPTFRILENALTPRDSGANSIEIEDRAHAETPPAGSGAPGSTSGGSGGGC